MAPVICWWVPRKKAHTYLGGKFAVKHKALIGTLAGAGIVTAALALALGPLAPAASAATAKTSGMTPHQMGIRGAKPKSATTTAPLAYGGGPVETTPGVYIIYWGSQWASGFSTGGYTSAQAQTYNQDFFGNVGGSSWDNTNTQYCQGVATGATSCTGATTGNTITNPTGQLLGVWTDNSTLPNRITQSGIAAEAVKSVTSGVFPFNPNATYFVYTPSGDSMRGFGTQWCAWHSSTSSGGNTYAYAYMPYIPDAGTSCGMNYVNSTNDSFGNGYFDGFSIVGGHEYAEAITDPHPSSGWTNSSGSEIGDLCAWNSNGGVSGNITLGSNYFAVQPLWSNATTTSTGSHCVMSYPN